MASRRLFGALALLVWIAGVAAGQAGASPAARATPATPAAASRIRGAESGGEAVSSADLASLAERAVTSPAAFDRLVRIRTVDGHPVDLAAAFAGATPEARAARLHQLAADADAEAGAIQPGAASTSADAARASARAILGSRRYQPKTPPRPLRGPLRVLGGWLRALGRPFASLWRKVADSTLASVGFAGAVLLFASVATVGLARRRSAAAVTRELSTAGPRDVDPAELDRQADVAARAGDYRAAVKLRFRAGLARLVRAGALSHRASLTTGQLRHEIVSEAFAPLATAFDEIAYGDRPAGADDDARAIAGWTRVLETAGGRR